MKKIVLTSWEHTTLTSFALILFISVFAGVLYWASNKSNKDAFQQASKLPLEDGRKK